MICSVVVVRAPSSVAPAGSGFDSVSVSDRTPSAAAVSMMGTKTFCEVCPAANVSVPEGVVPSPSAPKSVPAIAVPLTVAKSTMAPPAVLPVRLTSTCATPTASATLVSAEANWIVPPARRR